MTTYAHMCRDGHTEIGHNNSSSEMCPLCDVQAQLAQERYGRYHHVGGDEKCLSDCPGCERNGLQQRVQFTRNYESLVTQLAQCEQERDALRGAFESEHGDRMVLLLHVRDREAERDAARAALSAVAAAILPDETKRATWDAAALASLATAHREDSAWMDEHHDTLEADPVPAAREGKE